MVAQGHSFAAAYRAIYPPRQGERSKQAELVAAKRLAHHPAVEQRTEELRQQLLASDPDEMRRRALTALSKIMTKRLDPRYRRTAVDVLKYLDERARATIRAEGEKYRVLLARLAALKATEAVIKNRADSPSAQQHVKAGPREAGGVNESKRPVTPETAEDVARRRAEIEQVIEERRRMRKSENLKSPAPPVKNARSDDSPRAAEEDAAVEKSGFQWVRKRGHFGKGAWLRVPVPR
jgi:hypothetical protein